MHAPHALQSGVPTTPTASADNFGAEAPVVPARCCRSVCKEASFESGKAMEAGVAAKMVGGTVSPTSHHLHPATNLSLAIGFPYPSFFSCSSSRIDKIGANRSNRHGVADTRCSDPRTSSLNTTTGCATKFFQPTKL